MSRLTKEIVKNRERADAYKEELWRLNAHKLKSEFLAMIEKNDIIISASPAMRTERISDKLKTNNIIGSEIDLDTGELKFMCFRKKQSESL